MDNDANEPTEVASPRRHNVRRGPRVSNACVNCRRRKVKCTGEKPRCQYCTTYQKVCVYEELVKRQRPTHARVERLEEELRQLKGSASPPPERGESSGTAPALDSPRPAYNVTPATAVQRSSNSTPSRHPGAPSWTPAAGPATPGGPSSTYHGATSASHDGAVHERLPHRWFTAEREALMPNLLFAAAARQRQMEKLNANLDFDGVDPELAWHLLDLHWNRQHHAFMVTYRPAFMRDMATGGPYFSRILLNAIYFGASKFSPRLELRKVTSDVRTAGWQFRDRVRDLLGRALDYSNITTIQALLLMCNSLFALGDEPSAAWIYAGNAFRMIIDLGLHVDVTSRSSLRHLTDEDIEVRRRVFWAAFGEFERLFMSSKAFFPNSAFANSVCHLFDEVQHGLSTTWRSRSCMRKAVRWLQESTPGTANECEPRDKVDRWLTYYAIVIDKIQSLYQGRTAVLQEVDCHVPIKFLDEYEELEHWQPFAYACPSEHSGSPCYNVSTFSELCKLSVILNQVVNTMYGERRKTRSLSHQTKDLERLDKALLDWKSDLPSHLKNALACGPETSVPPPHALSLRAIWHVLRILLHRPFVLDSDPNVRASPTAHACIEVCTSEAANIVQLVRLYDVSFSVRQAPYLISYATYVAATIHVRLASSSAPGSTAHESLAVCLTVLDLNSKTNPAVRKASVVIEALMKAMNVNMEKPAISSVSKSASQRDARMSLSVAAGSMQQPTLLNSDMSIPGGGPQQLQHGGYRPHENLHAHPQSVPADIGAYSVEAGNEYFGDFAFEGMDDILFGFNASESIFQDFM